jgi:alkane 1-monooxygenase
MHAFQVESQRIAKQKKPWYANEVTKGLLLQFGLVLTIWTVFGTVAMFGFLLAAWVGIILLETINYIEHYGLLRSKRPNGFYEPVGPNHSWNSDHRLGRLLLFELSRHSDHHHNAAKKYH